MALPTIVFNSSGSDTQASGAPSSFTAIFGTAAATAANTSVTLSVDAPDLSGVAVDGTAAIWVNSSSGRQWSRITAIDNVTKVVTVATAYANTESGKTWAIGGKRSTLAGSLRAGQDWEAGWSIDVQTDQTLTAAQNVFVATGTETMSAPNYFFCSQTTRATITTSTNSINLINSGSQTDPIIFRHLKFTNTAATKGTAGSTGNAYTSANAAVNGVHFYDCVFDGLVSAVMLDNVTNFGTNRIAMIGCEIINCTSHGVSLQFSGSGAALFATFDHCLFYNNTGDGLRLTGAAGIAFVSFCTFSTNAKGIDEVNTGTTTSAGYHIINSNFVSNTGAGINLPNSAYNFTCHDCIFDSNGDYGIKMTATHAAVTAGSNNPPLLFNNAFYNNTTGTVANGPASFTDITLTGSPFTSSTDWKLNATAGAGAACKAVATVAPGMSSNTAGDIGAVPTGGGASTGGLLRNPDLNGGTR